MIFWIGDEGPEYLVPAAYLPGGEWVTRGDLAYRHLLPGTWIAGATALAELGDRFELETAKVTAEAYLFRSGEVLVNSSVLMELFVGAEMQDSVELDPTWDEDIVVVESLSAILHRDEVLTLRLSREDLPGSDTVGVLLIRFLVREPQE